MQHFVLYTYRPNYRAWKILIAAEYNNITIDVPSFRLHTDNVTEEFLKKNPFGKVPVLETSHGCVYESNAIARYVARLRADSFLYGETFFESSQVDQWIDTCAFELEPNRAIWLFPIMGVVPASNEVQEAARKATSEILRILNDHLANSTYIVGRNVTLADIVFVCALIDMYRYVFKPSYRNQFPNVTKWLVHCCSLPEFVRVLGEVNLKNDESSPLSNQN